ncbi:MAG: riboflavin synthase [Gammaproteobacteria bacterium]|jgi:riboflavin synthase|nr:riboflavin synthase [Gammaproteobacteria bacterium]
MFTGIVQDVGQIVTLERRGGDVRLRIAVDRLSLAVTRAGDSIAVSGVCLTALEIDTKGFSADVSNETLSLTTLGALEVGSRVNLEPALKAGDALGGHLVSGHVDGLGEVLEVREDARSVRMRFACPPSLAKYFARKGSVAIDGVSLTINEVGPTEFSVNLIPHTQAVTTLGEFKPGRRVNLEVDQVARYVERLLDPQVAR